MEQTDHTPPPIAKRFLRVYQIEHKGPARPDWRQLSPMVTCLFFLAFVFLYFGVLLILHHIAGTPQPTDPQDIWRYPLATFYPNLNAIMFDLIGNPILLVLFVYFKFIPDQLAQLEQSGFIKEKPGASEKTLTQRLIGNVWVQRPGPVVAAIIISWYVGDIRFSTPPSALAVYTAFLSTLGRYCLFAVATQFVYAGIILHQCQFNFRLHLGHPDECSGLAPFGKLAMHAYLYLFVFAMMRAVGTLTGSTGVERTLKSMIGPEAFIFLLIVFPVAIALVFFEFIYRPHDALEQLQRQYLLNASKVWTRYHKRLLSNVKKTMRQTKSHNSQSFKSESDLLSALVRLLKGDPSQPDTENKASSNFSEDEKLLETLAKLTKPIEEMHTWPIPKRTFQTMAVLTNPLVPMLLPIVVDAVKGLLP